MNTLAETTGIIPPSAPLSMASSVRSSFESTYPTDSPLSRPDSGFSAPLPPEFEVSHEGLVFGFVPQQLITTIENSRNWRDRVNAVQ